MGCVEEADVPGPVGRGHLVAAAAADDSGIAVIRCSCQMSRSPAVMEMVLMRAVTEGMEVTERQSCPSSAAWRRSTCVESP